MIQSKSAITALIGTRVNPVKTDGTQVPFLTYEIVGTRPNHAKNTVSGLDFVMVDFHLYHNSSTDLESLSKIFRDNIDGFSGSDISYAYFMDGGDNGFNTETNNYEYQQEYKLEIKR